MKLDHVGERAMLFLVDLRSDRCMLRGQLLPCTLSIGAIPFFE